MDYVLKYTFLILSITLISSCASLNESECKNGNWRQIGEVDGKKGATLASLSFHQKACAKYDISVNAGQYKDGRKKGLKLYCHPKNGLKIGLRGLSYLGVCSSTSFKKNYEFGKNIFVLQEKIARVENEILRLENLLDAKTFTKSRRHTIRNQIRIKKRDLRLHKNRLLIYEATRSEILSEMAEIIPK